MALPAHKVNKVLQEVRASRVRLAPLLQYKALKAQLARLVLLLLFKAQPVVRVNRDQLVLLVQLSVQPEVKENRAQLVRPLLFKDLQVHRVSKVQPVLMLLTGQPI